MSIVNTSLRIRPYISADCVSIADAHVRFYKGVLGWNEAFCQYSTSIPYSYDAAPKNPRSEIWIAELNETFAGCIMLKENPAEPTSGQLRIFMVEPWARNQGVGSALLETLMTKAKADHYQKLFLETCEQLKAARRAYRRLGFVCTKSWSNTNYRDDGQPVQEEYWEMEL